MVITEGKQFRTYTADVYSSSPQDPNNHFDFPAEYWIGTPFGGMASSTIYYYSANGIDLTVGGAGTSFFIAGSSDNEGAIDVTFVDSNFDTCTSSVELYDYHGNYYDPYESLSETPLTSFTGCDLTDITDIEVTFTLPSSIDYVIRRIGINSDPPPEEDKLVIDDFVEGGNKQSVYVRLRSNLEATDPPVSDSDLENAGNSCTNLLGCTRYLEMIVFEGNRRRRFNADVFTSSSQGGLGELYMTTASDSVADIIVRYDVSSSPVDLTVGGTGHRFYMETTSNFGGFVDVTFTDSASNVCAATMFVPDSFSSSTSIARSFEAFSDNCDLTDIAYAEVVFHGGNAIDFDVQHISITGPV
jgi:hypothetical protein